jgi:hypothetical protein
MVIKVDLQWAWLGDPAVKVPGPALELNDVGARGERLVVRLLKQDDDLSKVRACFDVRDGEDAQGWGEVTNRLPEARSADLSTVWSREPDLGTPGVAKEGVAGEGVPDLQESDARRAVPSWQRLDVNGQRDGAVGGQAS